MPDTKELVERLRRVPDAPVSAAKIAKEAADALEALTATPAGVGVVEALKQTRELVAEAALTGFNCHDGDWADRLFRNQGALTKALASLATSEAPAGNVAGVEIVREAMSDAWNEICADTGCHPLDITRKGRELHFSPNHWADLTALRIQSAALSASVPAGEAARSEGEDVNWKAEWEAASLIRIKYAERIGELEAALAVQVAHMVERFLAWRLPDDFNPDGGITFKAEFNEHTPFPMRHEPRGTNLLDARQAEAMVRYITAGLPQPVGEPSGRPAPPPCSSKNGEESMSRDHEPSISAALDWQPIDTAPFDDSVILLWREGDREAFPGWWLGADRGYEWAFVDETSGRSHKGIEPNAYRKGDGPTHWAPILPPQSSAKHHGCAPSMAARRNPHG